MLLLFLYFFSMATGQSKLHGLYLQTHSNPPPLLFLFPSFPPTARMTFQPHRLRSHLLQVSPTTLKSPPGMSLAAYI